MIAHSLTAGLVAGGHRFESDDGGQGRRKPPGDIDNRIVE